MRILVTGATGFIGYEVARQLSDSGVRPRLLVWSLQRARLLKKLDAEIVVGDLLNADSLRRAVDSTDAVIHLAARAAFESYRRVRPTIVDGSRTLMQAAIDAGVERFVLASSLFVYGGQRDEIDQWTPIGPVIDYGVAKVEAEQILAQAADAAGVRFAAVRLPHVYGARDLFFEHVRKGLVVLAGRGPNLFSHLHVADAARVLIAAARSDWAGALPVADDRPTEWREFAVSLQRIYPRFRILRVPAGLARLGTELLRPLVALRRRPSLYTPDTVIGWNLNLPVRPRVLWDELGLQPDYPTIDTGLPAALHETISRQWRHPHADSSLYRRRPLQD